MQSTDETCVRCDDWICAGDKDEERVDYACISESLDLLEFMRFDKFKEIFIGSPNQGLTACIADMETHGFSVDLGKRGLGPGKLFVNGNQAGRAIEALEQYCARNGQLKPCHVVVSQKYKAIVLQEVAIRAPRINQVRACTAIAL